MPNQPTKSDQVGGDFFGWIRVNPLGALLVGAIAATLIYFFYFLRLFSATQYSTLEWAWQAWSPQANYEHAKLIPLIVLFLIWHGRKNIKAAPIGSSRWGWLFIGVSVLLFVVGARSLQGRLSLTALPVLLFGIVLYSAGPQVARALLFPIGFLLFMVPLNFLTQGTTGLQAFETKAASAICNLLGVGVYALGNTINATNESFRFQIDDGCSGIRSLMAIVMLSALYGHFTQDRFWKKLAIFAASILFAIIGNTGRLISIILVARFFGQDLAGGPYHAISGYLSFPFALLAMVLFGKLLNIAPKHVRAVVVPKETISYDY